MSDMKRLRQLIDLAQRQEAIVDSLARQHNEAANELTHLQREVIPAVMSELGMQEFKADDGTVVSLTEGVSASIPPEKKAAAMRWLRVNGHEGIVKRELLIADHVDELAAEAENHEATYNIKESVHAATLKSWAKEMLLHGAELPDDLFNVNGYTWAKITKPKTQPGG